MGNKAIGFVREKSENIKMEIDFLKGYWHSTSIHMFHLHRTHNCGINNELGIISSCASLSSVWKVDILIFSSNLYFSYASLFGVILNLFYVAILYAFLEASFSLYKNWVDIS